MDQVFSFWFGVAVISVIGTIAHFLYDWSNHNKIVGLFAAVNESTWEHIKIALTPTLLYSLYDGYIYGTYKSYFFAKLISLLLVIILIPLIYYLYNLILKKDLFFINILIFYFTIFISQLVFYNLLKINNISFLTQYISCILLFILFGCYLLLTLLPLEIELFKDPITNKYGFKGH